MKQLGNCHMNPKVNGLALDLIRLLLLLLLLLLLVVVVVSLVGQSLSSGVCCAPSGVCLAAIIPTAGLVEMLKRRAEGHLGG